jgi:hypothetical protein
MVTIQIDINESQVPYGHSAIDVHRKVGSSVHIFFIR